MNLKLFLQFKFVSNRSHKSELKLVRALFVKKSGDKQKSL